MSSSHEDSISGGTGRRYRLSGLVQGVGFRPWLCREGVRLGLRGWVRNGPGGVEAVAAGGLAALDAFEREFQHPPAGAVIAGVVVEPWPEADLPVADGFQIIESGGGGTGENLPVVAPDLGICGACREEIQDRGSRRFRYAFTTCASCGPRYTILEGLPFDRERTVMRAFPLCPACKTEYEDVGDRRFHAQAMACPACGPKLMWRDASGTVRAEGEEAMACAVSLLREGRVVAVKGVGGFHLMVRADEAEAVGRLRERKRRPMKPLAIMVADAGVARRVGRVGEVELALLESAAAPIVMLERWGAGEELLAGNVAPEVPCVGVMLAATPLHLLLLAGVGVPVVATSGNRSEEPLCIEDAEAVQRLCGVADGFLGHNRPIARSADDSLVRAIGGGGVVLRRGRGYAPVEVTVRGAWKDAVEPGILGAGGQMKSTVALSRAGRVLVSPHVGDLDHPLARQAWRRGVRELCVLWGGEPPVRGAVDLHPDYASTREAEGWQIPLVPVQHHVAHAVAAMAEVGWEKAVAVVWDGTGLGTDGTVWGGECLEIICGTGWRRAGRLRPFLLPGGERAVREPRRAALGVVWEMRGRGGQAGAGIGGRLGFSPEEGKVLERMLGTGAGCLTTSSAGRLFDAAAVLLGWGYKEGYEAQAAMALESWAAGASEAPGGGAVCGVRNLGRLWELDWAPAVEKLLSTPPEEAARAAREFHHDLAEGLARLVQGLGAEAVVLTGGCFQNRLLAELFMGRCHAMGLPCFLPRALPANDGGLAVGQVLAAGLKEVPGEWCGRV